MLFPLPTCATCPLRETVVLIVIDYLLHIIYYTCPPVLMVITQFRQILVLKSVTSTPTKHSKICTRPFIGYFLHIIYYTNISTQVCNLYPDKPFWKISARVYLLHMPHERDSCIDSFWLFTTHYLLHKPP